jgi:hypothetical protein
MNTDACCREIYLGQAGGGFIPYYTPQKGGSIFGSVLRGVGNFFKTKVAPSLIEHGADFLQDVVSGKNVAESAKKRGIQALQNTINRTINNRGVNKITNKRNSSVTSRKKIGKKQRRIR